jgi:pimeloyl-ACP methyl ester carboxylesterase
VKVVVEHGYALDHRSWRAIAALLPQAVEGLVGVLVYDHRGHGESGRVSTAAATMTQLGHVMGGLAAMWFTQRHRALFADRVSGWCCCQPRPSVSPRRLPRRVLMRSGS